MTSKYLAPLKTKFSEKNGMFGQFGGTYVDERIQKALVEISTAWEELKKDKNFWKEFHEINKNYSGRPTPLYEAKKLSASLGGARIFLKREDLNHTGAHKLNHCIGEVLLAKHLGKKKVIAETGAGQHGVALATAAALLGLDCDIYMGEIDIKKEAPNVSRMKILGAKVIPVTRGTKTLKDAVDDAFDAWLGDTKTTMYAIGSVVGPYPFPEMVRDFQSIIGLEVKEQFKELTGLDHPDHICACVGGGSNSMGIFNAFLDDERVSLHGFEPAGKGLDTPLHAASLQKGTEGIIHGFKTIVLQDEKGGILPVYSIASGLDYPAVGPQHSFLREKKRVHYDSITDREAVEAFYILSRLEGIIPALESSHAVAGGASLAAKLEKDKTVVINLSGRGDKDIDFVMKEYPLSHYDGNDGTSDYEKFMKHIANRN